MKIWVISDTHFGHSKIIEYEKRPEDFNEKIVTNWNNMVSNEDYVIHLGDIVFKDYSYLKKLNGKIILVRGNHDNGSFTKYINSGIMFVVDSFTLNIYGKKLIFSHEPLSPVPLQFDLNIHGHLHTITNDDIAKYNLGIRHKCFTIEHSYKPVLLEKFIGGENE
jgi:calcineurin-like phosphoesterase family protein